MKTLFRMTRSLSLNSTGIFRTAIIGAVICLSLSAGSTINAATITVDTTSDGFILTLPGQPLPCRLRDAITAANTNRAVGGCVKGDPSPVVDTILFKLGAGTPTIKPRFMLPVITEPVIIRGDSGGATRVEINGSDASWRAALFGQRVHGLFLVTGESTIRNLVINRFNGNGIVLTTDAGGHITDFTPPTITDPTLPTEPPCFARPADPDCPPGGGSGGPDLPSIGGADTRNKVIGCFIGTDATGTVALSNGSGPDTAGITTDTDMHTIGGTTAAERNVISGNHGHGLILGGKGHWVRGNFIGTDVSGALPLGNQFDGINVAGGQFSSATGVIGANTNAADAQCGMVINSSGVVTNDHKECGNKIAFNHRNGISGGFNLYGVLSNSIFSNGELGIDVDQFGVTPNAANRSRNFPVFTWRRREINLQAGIFGTRVGGSITNFTGPAVVIQFFHSPSCDSSNHGEEQTYLGSITLPGNGAFSFFVPGTGGVVTATATKRFGAAVTSEFSACLPI